MKSLIMILIPLTLAGCAAVQYNDGKTVSIQSDGWYGLDSLQTTANEACQQYGKEKATYVHSANMNPHLPKGSGVQNTVWKCE
ncbi:MULTISPECIES: hypothetical protein [Enterobacter]|uniref:hypothetical protein n=1 Tax=Enterobacter sp. 148H3 TaxID=3077756 RepID=UPI000DCEC47D|nr:hypothetical protein [Enterobacter sp. 148H3]RAY80233.1 hypothetical protein DP190_19815 [Enterobacter cloacae]